MKPCVLVDANNLIYRAHFGHKDLKTSDGRPTSVLFGFPMMLLDLWKEVGPTDMVIVWDRAVPGLNPMVEPPCGDCEMWRKRLAQSYKGNRKPNPEIEPALLQLPTLALMLRKMGLVQVAVPTLEADDLIGIFSTALARDRKTCERVLIYSTDKDFRQLVDDKRVRILQPMKGQFQYLGPDQVQDQHGVPPEFYPHFKALCGDMSDNIKGVHGIGPKRAAQMIMSGLDPSLPAWHLQAAPVRRKYPELEREWKNIHTCYLLTHIPRTADYEQFHPLIQKELPRVVEVALRRRSRPIRRERFAIRQRELLSLFADYELNILLARRTLIFRDVTLFD